MKKLHTVFLAAAITLTAGALAAVAQQATPYAGQQARMIKSLSAKDITAIEAGQGWGLAKPAELNGYPGPLHVLEVGSQLGLDDRQRARIQKIFDDMQAAAKRTGKVFLDAERALDQAFAKGKATPPIIDTLTLASAQARAKLQAVHLRAHLLTTPLLSKVQRHRYQVLRGYGAGHKGHPRKGPMGSHHGH